MRQRGGQMNVRYSILDWNFKVFHYVVRLAGEIEQLELLGRHGGKRFPHARGRVLLSICNTMNIRT